MAHGASTFIVREGFLVRKANGIRLAPLESVIRDGIWEVKRVLGGFTAKMTRVTTALSAVVFVVVGCVGQPSVTDGSSSSLFKGKQQAAIVKDGRKGADSMTEFTYGFRHDPMRWVSADESLQGARVRSQVLQTPKAGDTELVQAEIDKILAAQLPDGRLSDDEKHAMQFTAERLIRLAELGCPSDRAEVQKAIAAIRGKGEVNKADPLGIYDIRAFCLLGMTEDEGIRKDVIAGLEAVVARQAEWRDLNKGCPWTPIEHLITLWYGRHLANTEAIVVETLNQINDGLNAAGCLSYKDPWGFVRLASVVDHPVACKILEKEVPVLLRGQDTSGGWGDRSLFVFRALKKHRLLDELEAAPPLPPDWRIEKTIPAPEAACSSLTWDGRNLWTRSTKTGEAIAVSPKDGRVVRRVELPYKDVSGIGWWDDALAIAQKNPKRLLKVSPETGEIQSSIPLDGMEWINGVTQVGARLMVGDGFLGCGVMVDPKNPGQQEHRVLGGPIPVDLAAEGSAVWHTDVWAPAIIKSDSTKHGQLLDWGEKPFDGHCAGIAHDGKNLWALDARNKRICVIERTSGGTASDRADAIAPAAYGIGHVP